MNAELGGCQRISKSLEPLQGHFHSCRAQTCQCVCMYSRDVQKLSSWQSLLLLSVCNCPVQIWLKSAQNPNTERNLANQLQDEQWLTFPSCMRFGLMSMAFELGNTELDYSQKRLPQNQDCHSKSMSAANTGEEAQGLEVCFHM